MDGNLGESKKWQRYVGRVSECSGLVGHKYIAYSDLSGNFDFSLKFYFI